MGKIEATLRPVVGLNDIAGALRGCFCGVNIGKLLLGVVEGGIIF